MNIQPVAFVDTWAFASTLYAKYKDRFGGDHHSLDLLPLRSTEGALPILSEWKSARALLARIRTAVSPLTGGKTADMGAAALVRLRAGGFAEWRRDETDYMAVHLAIVPGPGAWVYAGGECGVLPVGQLTYVNHRVLYSAANFGEYPVIHLIAEVREPDAEG